MRSLQTNKNVKDFTPNEILRCVLGDLLRDTSVSNISYCKEENQPKCLNMNANGEGVTLFSIRSEQDIMSILGFDGKEASND